MSFAILPRSSDSASSLHKRYLTSVWSTGRLCAQAGAGAGDSFNVREICIDISVNWYPVEDSKLAQPVIITSEQPGVVVWGYNIWRMHQKKSGRMVRRFQLSLGMTPINELQGGGFYVDRPFEPVKDEALERSYSSVNQLSDRSRWQISRQRPSSRTKNILSFSKFRKFAMVIEGNAGHGRQHGLSLSYRRQKTSGTLHALKFAKIQAGRIPRKNSGVQSVLPK